MTDIPALIVRMEKLAAEMRAVAKEIEGRFKSRARFLHLEACGLQQCADVLREDWQP